MVTGSLEDSAEDYSKNYKLNIFLIRHGQSEANVNLDLEGQDVIKANLTEEGRKQAAKLGKFLSKTKTNFDYVYSSTLPRSIQTTEICLENMDSHVYIRKVEDIIEFDPNFKKSVVPKEINQLKMRSEKIRRQGSWFKENKGESWRMAKKRITDWFLNEIVFNLKYENRDINIGIFSHGAIIKCLLMEIMSFDEIFLENIYIENTSICQLQFSNDGWVIYGINDRRHFV